VKKNTRKYHFCGTLSHLKGYPKYLFKSYQSEKVHQINDLLKYLKTVWPRGLTRYQDHNYMIHTKIPPLLRHVVAPWMMISASCRDVEAEMEAESG